MLVLKNIHKRYGIRRVLEGVSFGVGEGQKIAIVGGNGTGKSTLLKIIAGEENFEKGTRILPNRILIGYLPQETTVFHNEAVLEYLERQSGLTEQRRIMEISAQHPEDPHHIERYTAAQFAYERLGGGLFLKRAHHFLKGLLIHTLPLDAPAELLSGGQKRKLALTGVLLRGVDLLVLDEPTNNLDLPALTFLEKYLQKTKATVVLASHDRAFLDAVVSKVFEIHWFTRTIEQFTGGWSDYEALKRHQLRRQKELWREQETERKRLEGSEEQKRDWAERIKDAKAPDSDKMAAHFKRERATKKFNASAKSIVSRLKRLTDHEKPLERRPPVMLLSSFEDSGSDIGLSQVVVGYPSSFSSEPIDLFIPFGTRLAILGNNGTGKTTLVKTITGEQAPLGGTLKKGEGIRFGYFIQEHDTLNQEQGVFEYIKTNTDTPLSKEDVLFELGRFGLAPDIIDDKLRELSPGERVRVILARLVLFGANTLILDEPTNHLDLDAIEALEEALQGFPGTLIVVSHDRQFLKNLKLETSFEL